MILGSDVAGIVASSTSSSSAAKSANAVSSACNGGGCQKEITGQCCKYQSETNAYCQKVMAPYTDSCSSCNGTGVSGGGSPSSGSGSGNSGAVTSVEAAPYELSFTYDAAIVDFVSSSFVTNPYGLITAVAFSSTSLFRMNNTNPELVTSIFISETDSTGDDATPVFDILNGGDTIVFTKDDDAEVFAFFKLLDQVDNGDNRTFMVEYISHNGTFAQNDIAVFGCSRNIIKIPAGATTVTACPDCGGTGLEGSGGGLEGVIMAVYNGSAGFAGVINVDIYGIVQPS
jgi:hypothetical protein